MGKKACLSTLLLSTCFGYPVFVGVYNLLPADIDQPFRGQLSQRKTKFISICSYPWKLVDMYRQSMESVYWIIYRCITDNMYLKVQFILLINSVLLRSVNKKVRHNYIRKRLKVTFLTYFLRNCLKTFLIKFWSSK